jgi:hypothetical protein
VQAGDKEITARINYYTSVEYNPFIGKDAGAGRQKEQNQSDNQATYKIDIGPGNRTVETSVESVKAYNQHGKEVTQFVSGQTYTIKATYKNDSSEQTSFPVRLAFGSTTPPGSGEWQFPVRELKLSQKVAVNMY